MTGRRERRHRRRIDAAGKGDAVLAGHAAVDRLAEQLPDAAFLFLPTVGHVPQFEATDEILAALLPFLARVLDGADGKPRRGRSASAGQAPARARSKAR